jgi:hypothetical protein
MQLLPPVSFRGGDLCGLEEPIQTMNSNHTSPPSESRTAGVGRNGPESRSDLTLPVTSDAQIATTLPGLTPQETEEFLALDQTAPYDGLYVWPDDLPAIPTEERWRLLWVKQCRATGWLD